MSQELLCTLLFTIGCLLYAAYVFFKRRWQAASANANGARQANIEVVIDQLGCSRYQNNSSAIESLPTFTYTNSNNQGIESGTPSKTPVAHECVICLNNVVEGEVVGVLPNCLHVFHVQCIEMWLFSHSNCPVCRSVVEPAPSPQVPATSPVVVSVRCT